MDVRWTLSLGSRLALSPTAGQPAYTAYTRKAVRRVRVSKAVRGLVGTPRTRAACTPQPRAMAPRCFVGIILYSSLLPSALYVPIYEARIITWYYSSRSAGEEHEGW